MATVATIELNEAERLTKGTGHLNDRLPQSITNRMTHEQDSGGQIWQAMQTVAAATRCSTSGAVQVGPTCQQITDVTWERSHGQYEKRERQPRCRRSTGGQTVGSSDPALARALQHRQGPDPARDDHVLRHLEESRRQRKPCRQAARRPAP